MIHVSYPYQLGITVLGVVKLIISSVLNTEVKFKNRKAEIVIQTVYIGQVLSY